MSDRDAGATQPLLPSSSPTHPETRTEDGTVRASDMVKQENLGRAAWPIQASALLFVALVWSIVFSKMSPWSLPLFGYHPLIQSFAILVLVQAIVVLQRTSAQKSQSEKQAAFRVHQWINVLLVLPLFTVGASIMWYLHDQPNAKHFVSWHGILGTTLVAWAWVQAAIGAATVAFNGKLVGGPNRAKSLYKYHRLSGYVLLPLFLLTAFLGVVETTWASQNASLAVKAAVGAMLALAFAALVGRIDTSKLPKLSN